MTHEGFHSYCEGNYTLCLNPQSHQKTETINISESIFLIAFAMWMMIAINIGYCYALNDQFNSTGL